MRIRFEGFGLNFPTGLLVILIAALLSTTLVLAGPLVSPSGGTVEAATVAPCKPYAWRERAVAWKYNVPLNEVWVEARIRYNGCEVYVIPGTRDCWWKGGIYSVSVTSCRDFRVNLHTAYGQNVVIVGRFQVSLFWTGFPIGTNVISCHRYDRRGVLIGQSYGPYASTC